MTPFDFLKEIQYGKRDLMQDPQCEKEYVPFIVNRALSYEQDCIMQASDMNRYHHTDKKLQYHFLLHTVRQRRRGFHKFIKPEVSESLTAIKTIFECSNRKAEEILKIITPEQLTRIQEATEKGGKVTKSKK